LRFGRWRGPDRRGPDAGGCGPRGSK
jgi:hypothetical protein